VNSRVVIITGMHRSGTSLAASLFQRAGVDVGDRLIEAADPNPHGYFEDADFVEFHEQALKDRSRTILVGDDFIFEPTDDEARRARELLATRGVRPVWGWKDPRTALFLGFWDSQLDGARYLFMFRHPLDVLVSLLRRREYQALGLVEAIRAWETYNGRILEFKRQQPERCALIHAQGLGSLNDLNRALARLEIPGALTDAMISEVLRPAELRSTGTEAQGCFDLIQPAAAQLYGDLVHAADVLPMEAQVEGPPTLGEFRSYARDMLPGLESHRRGLLLTLLELLEPTVTEEAFAGGHEWIRQLEEARQWLEAQLTALERRSIRRRLERLAHRWRSRSVKNEAHA
jgi:hypothetical protein